MPNNALDSAVLSTAVLSTAVSSTAVLSTPVLSTAAHSTVTAPSSVSEFLRRRRSTPSQTLLSRLFGRHPIPVDLRPMYREARGDVAVLDAITHLGPEWIVLHSQPDEGDARDIAHIVIGPAGLFSITVRHHPDGAIWIDGGVILVDGERVPHIRDAEWQAVRITQLMSDAVGSRVDVTPCLAMVDPRSLTVSKPPRRVAVLTPRDLRAWLKGMPRVLSSEQIQSIRTAASNQRGWSDASTPDQESAESLQEFRRAQSEVSQARHLRLTWVTGLLVLAWLIAFVCVGGVTSSLFFR